MGDIRPTAKWANRMLRPLTSIYHRLEKHQDNICILASASAKRADGRSSTATAAAKGPGPEYRFDSNSEPDDPAWVPGRSVKRRIRHSYSSRGQRIRGGKRRSRLSIRSPEVQRTLPGAIEIATPLITGQKATMEGPGLLLEGAVVPRRRLFRDAADAPIAGMRSSHGGMATNSFYALYNTPWKEALEQCGDAKLVDIVRVLDTLFLKFLLNTRVRQQQRQQQQQQQGHGARPLFSMAVRQLPEFIAEEQIMQQEIGNPDEDMCDAYFTELEAHYAPSGNGWAPLCEAVRAQGIYLVSAMLQKPCFTRLMTCRLLDLCLVRQEYDAVESLLSAVLSTIDETYGCPTAFDSVLFSSSSSSSDGGDDPVQFLNSYWLRVPSRRSFVFRELAKLLRRGALPAEWMVTTRWKKIVGGAIQSLSTGENDSAAAARFLEAVLLTASSIFPGLDEDIVASGGGRVHFMHLGTEFGRQSPCPIPIQDALSNLALSLVTALCGMHLARSCAAAAAAAVRGENQAIGMRVRTIMGSVALGVQREIKMRYLSGENAKTRDRSSPIYDLRRGSVLLGSCLLQCSGGHAATATNIDTFYQTLSSRPDMIKDLAVLACQVFSCAQRVRKTDNEDRSGTPVDVRAQVVRLAEMSDQRSLGSFLGKIAAETAMQLADATVDPEDHVWAVEVQERVLRRQQQQEISESLTGSLDGYDDGGSGSESDDHPGLYRWEESIEEWVAATPVSKTRTTMVVERPRAVEWTMTSSSAGTSPSSRASSTSRSSRASTPEDAASSVTSSAPSCVPVKRPYPGLSWPAKRLRTASGSASASWGGSRAMSETTSTTASEEEEEEEEEEEDEEEEKDDDDDHDYWQDDDQSVIRSQPEFEVLSRQRMRCSSEVQEQEPGGENAGVDSKRRPTHAPVGGTRDEHLLEPGTEDEDDEIGHGSGRSMSTSTKSIPRRSVLSRMSIPPELLAVAADEDSDDELSFL